VQIQIQVAHPVYNFTKPLTQNISYPLIFDLTCIYYYSINWEKSWLSTK